VSVPRDGVSSTINVPVPPLRVKLGVVPVAEI
jgi:hypothetical protein